MADLLIEIQTEELPANYLAYGDLNNQKLFRDAFQKGFDHINDTGAYRYQGLTIYLTPRRILFVCESVSADESEREEILYGPPADRAYDAAGKPTKVLEGFMNSKGASLDEIEVAEYKGRSCVACKRRVKPEPFSSQIQVLLDECVRTLNFPKFMWWDNSGFKFPRPVRGLMCFYRGEPVSIKLGEVRSAPQTKVFRNGSRTLLNIRSADDYFSQISKSGVVLSQADRKKQIKDSISSLAESAGSRASNQEELLEEVVFLTEAPVCLLGKYSDTFSDLPKKVLTSSLSKSQRLFELLQKDSDAHTPYDIVVLDGSVKEDDAVLRNVSSILTAKLQDSHFFFKEDSDVFADQQRLDMLRADLNNLVYLKGVGSVGEKCSR
ncbi:MAG: glycine--tRNA ligase subunit beta, partial [Candidatus Omnitrophica bacterium]|nr:glycine--tRNA ligase subunit beta [Candidatus Omnitrophota bacterium]